MTRSPRTLPLICLASLALAGGILQARAEDGPAPALAVQPHGGGVRPTYVVLPPPANRAPPPAAKAAPDAAAWCRSQRVVGTGAGFCLVN